MSAGVVWPYTLPESRDLDTEAAGIRAFAEPLAKFFFGLANRLDRWGGYWPVELRDKLGAVRTHPSRSQLGRASLTVDVLRRHFMVRNVGELVGLHALSPDGFSRFGAFDLDAHGDVTSTLRAELHNATVFLVDAMGERASVLLEDSNGNGGVHLWCYFDTPVPSADVYAWLQHLAKLCHNATGVLPETYPKQPAIASDKQCGSWFRLPSMHHTRAHISRGCRPGCPWASGAEFARVILEDWPATPASAIPPASAWPSPLTDGHNNAQAVRSLADVPQNRAAVIAAYVRKLPHGRAGTERSNKLFALARFLRHGMLCTEAEALPVMREWDVGNDPPLGEAKVLTTWENAGIHAAKPYTLKVGGLHAA